MKNQEKKKITAFFTRKEITRKDPEINNTKSKPPENQPVNPDKTKPKASKSNTKKKKIEEEKKKARGYWLKLAETKTKQEDIKSKVKKPPDMTRLEQAHCKVIRCESGDNPCTPVQPWASSSKFPEVSNLRQVLYESEISKQIALGTKVTRKSVKGRKI